MTQSPPPAAAGSPPGRIELRLKDLNQLFDSFDPAPFHEKDLDQDAEEFIASWAREYPPETPLTFVLHLPESQRDGQPPAEAVVRDAIRNYFGYRAGLTGLELRRLLQRGRWSLLVGLSFLAACTLGRELLQRVDDPAWLAVVAEGLLIMGWVAMWRPLELLLYDWWPVLRQRRTYENLSRMGVEVRFGA